MKTYTLKMTDGSSLDLTEDQINQLTPDDEAQVAGMTEKPQPSQGPNPVSNDQLRDLYANAKEVGYSGLDRDQQALFNQQYPYSLAAKHGTSLADAIKATDYYAASTAGKIIRKAQDFAGDVYQGARDVVSAPIAGAAQAGSFSWNTLGDMVSHDEPVNLGQNWNDATKYAQEVYDKAAQGEGIPGMLSDPINLVPVGGAADVAKGLAKVGLPAAGKFIMGSWVPRALIGGGVAAGENAALTTLGNTIDPDRESSMPQSTGFGFTAGAIGSALPASHFASELPGVTTLMNRADGPAERQRILDAATDMYNKSTFLGLGGGQRSYQGVANKAENASTKLYDDLARSVSESDEFLPGDVRNATNVSGTPVTGNPVTIMNSRQVTLSPLPSVDMKKVMLVSLDEQNRADKAGFTKAQLSKAVDNYLERVSAVVPDPAPRDFLRPDQYISPKDILDSKSWLNSDIYNARKEPGAGDKAKLAQMLHTAVNERIGGMTDKAGQAQKDLASKAGKAYADYVLKQRIVDQGVKSASGRHGGSFWVPTAFGKGIQLGAGVDTRLSR